MYKNAWVVTVDMGYGHQRAAYPLRHLSPGSKVIVANNYAGIPDSDKRHWENGRSIYEFISRFSNFPVIGKYVFAAMDSFQKIRDFYPRRDLTRPTLQLLDLYRSIRKGWGKHLIQQLNTRDIPLITSFFTVAFFAEEHGFKNDIYCLICDSDCSRAWVALNPKKSRIKYLAPCRRVVERLKLYGVREENIFLTGFPLPDENLGGDKLTILKEDLAERLINLDPDKLYRHKYGGTVEEYLRNVKKQVHHHPLTLTFAIGGAGAQKAIGDQIILSLRHHLLQRKINLNLVAGSRNDVYCYYAKQIKKLGLEKCLGQNLEIIYDENKTEYFRILNEALRHTDVLWTKPSEMVFYSALGLPIIMAPSLGSQEDYNRTWLKTIGAGISQNDPRFTHEWLFDWVKSGWLAEAAMAGFLDGRQFGIFNIKDVVLRGIKIPKHNHQLL